MEYTVCCPRCGHTASVSIERVETWLNNRGRRFRCTKCGSQDGKLQKPDRPSKAGLLVGSGLKGSHGKLIYHRPNCTWAGKLSWLEMVEFEDWKQAEFQGYSPCRFCKPRMNRPA